MRRACAVAVLGLALAGTGSAHAQQNWQPNASPKDCANSAGQAGDLSDKLSQSKGVLCPPDIDPGMKAPTPDTGKMPVIPPPGSPGGDQSVQPK